MHAAEGILTTRGGMTSHAAVVARGMGKPCVSGAGSLRVDYAAGTMTAGGQTFKKGDYITVDGSTGQVLAGKVYLSPAMTERLLGRVSGDGLDRSPVEALSDRELEVLRLIGGGVRTADIAGRLHLSVKTVETYRDRIRQKLALADGTALAQFATRWVVENS